jgi:hypothetical protein
MFLLRVIRSIAAVLPNRAELPHQIGAHFFMNRRTMHAEVFFYVFTIGRRQGGFGFAHFVLRAVSDDNELARFNLCPPRVYMAP